jgi:hypothetical protein
VGRGRGTEEAGRSFGRGKTFNMLLKL